MHNLLNLQYWFNLRPEPLSLLPQRLFIAGLIIMIVAAILIAILKNRGGIYRGWLKKVYSFCLSNASIGLILFFFNYEFVPFLSARFWLGLWVIIMIVWIFYLVRSLKNIPKMKEKAAQEKEMKKYLP